MIGYVFVFILVTYLQFFYSDFFIVLWVYFSWSVTLSSEGVNKKNKFTECVYVCVCVRSTPQRLVDLGYVSPQYSYISVLFLFLYLFISLTIFSRIILNKEYGLTLISEKQRWCFTWIGILSLVFQRHTEYSSESNQFRMCICTLTWMYMHTHSMVCDNASLKAVWGNKTLKRQMLSWNVSAKIR